jgi:hypothetical protein
MRETADDLAALQALVDRGAGAAGPHLRSIIPAERPHVSATAWQPWPPGARACEA